MGTVVDVTIPTDQFALAETVAAVPDATFEAVRVAAHGPRGMMQFLRVSSASPYRLHDALATDSTTTEVTRLSSASPHALYRIAWERSVWAVMGVFVGANRVLLDARGQSDRWEFRVVFPDQTSVSEACDSWREHGIDPSIRRVNRVPDLVEDGGIQLSHCQHETLLEAFEMDYYDVPRGITLNDLADSLDISHQALSERLRRGHRNLIETTIREPPTLVRHEP